MNNEKLKQIRIKQLGFLESEMAFHLNMPVADYEEIEKGEYKLSLGEIAIIKTLVVKYAIPHINNPYIMDIVKNPDIGLDEKARLIRYNSYNVLCQGADGHIDKSSLMDTREILLHLEARAEGDID